jgi:hypothetical protein
MRSRKAGHYIDAAARDKSTGYRACWRASKVHIAQECGQLLKTGR